MTVPPQGSSSTNNISSLPSKGDSLKHQKDLEFLKSNEHDEYKTSTYSKTCDRFGIEKLEKVNQGTCQDNQLLLAPSETDEKIRIKKMKDISRHQSKPKYEDGAANQHFDDSFHKYQQCSQFQLSSKHVKELFPFDNEKEFDCFKEKKITANTGVSRSISHQNDVVDANINSPKVQGMKEMYKHSCGKMTEQYSFKVLEIIIFTQPQNLSRQIK